MKKVVLFALVLLFSTGLISTGAYAFTLDIRCWEEANPGETNQETASTPSSVLGTTYITLAALNLRPTPGTQLPRLALAPQGALVQVLDYGNGSWYRVSFNGILGYMYAAFLERLQPATPIEIPDLGDLPPVELIDWHSANALITNRAPLTLIDVRTGIYWQVARFGGDLHADVETITAEDTAQMHRAFNYTWTWEPRPVVVLFEGRLLAASINGMPHGMVTNHRNNVNGHFCLHFHGSQAHGAANIDLRHHHAVIEAFFTAFEWQE